MTVTLSPKLAAFSDFTAAIDDPDHRDQLVTVLNWVIDTYPKLVPRYAWNQPMFTDHGTFIVSFSVAKPHFNVALEKVTLDYFAEQIKAQGDHCTTMLWQVKYDHPINWDLLQACIDYNLETKHDMTTFWRPKA